MFDPADAFSAQKAATQATDVVFPALHGATGEDGAIQKMLEDWRVTFVGSDSQASALCFDKDRFRKFMLEQGIMVPRGEVVSAEEFEKSDLRTKPFVLKPIDGGSSIDTLIVRRTTALDLRKVRDVFARHSQMLLEELIEGTEITVGILGEQALPVIEIIPPESGEFDYENKYNGATEELCPPRNVSEDLQQKAQEIALRAHKLCGCCDLSRSDFIIDKSGEIYLLEINTLPGMTAQSLFPKAANAAGLSMEELCEQLTQAALRRKKH